jgi:hypothetical protein
MRDRRRLWDEGGSVLLAALGGVVALSAIALAVALLARVETSLAGAERVRIELAMAADAAIEVTIASLAREDDWSVVLSGSRRAAVLEPWLAPRVAGWGPLDGGELTRALQRASDARGVWGSNRSIWRLYAEGAPGMLASLPPASAARRLSRAPPYAMVWLADDEADGDGRPLEDSNGVLSVRAEAFGVGRAWTAVAATLRRRAAGVELLAWRTASSGS